MSSKSPAPKPPKIRNDTIEKRVGPRSWKAARKLYEGNAVVGAVRRGTTLEGCVQDARGTRYEVEAVFAGRSLSAAYCECGARGDEGRCRHVAALLIAWSEDPEGFRLAEDLDAALARRSREELEDLIRELVAEEPELLARLVTPAGLAPGGPEMGAKATTEATRRRVATEFRCTPGDSEDAAWDLASRLWRILEEAEALRGQDHLEAACGTCAGVVMETAERYEEVQDECQVHDVIVEAAQRLTVLLKGSSDGDSLRKTALEALFRFWVFATEYAGTRNFLGKKDFGAVLFQVTSPAERAEFAARARGLLEGPKLSEYRKRDIGELLLYLEGKTLDVEGMLALCRETGLYRELLARLVKLKRLDAALEVLGEVPARGRKELAELLLGKGQDQAVFDTIRRLEEAGESDSEWEQASVFAWLALGYEKLGDLPAATECAQRSFQGTPTAESFVLLRRLAKLARRWSRLRPEILDQLSEKRPSGERPLILLEDGDLDGALVALEEYRGGFRAPCTAIWRVARRVAEVAEAKRPELACELYLKIAQEVAEGRSPEEYPEAVRCLKKIRALSQKRRSGEKWEVCIEDFQTATRRLSSLKRMLARAGF